MHVDMSRYTTKPFLQLHRGAFPVEDTANFMLDGQIQRGGEVAQLPGAYNHFCFQTGLLMLKDSVSTIQLTGLF
jgi:hypothetical protein